MNRLPLDMAERWPYKISRGVIGPAGESYAASVSLSCATKAHTAFRSGQVMTAMPSDLSTRKNSARARGTSWGYRCSMLWEEKTASTDSEETVDMSVMVPTRSGLTDSSMSNRSSFQADKALVVRSLRLGPQPTWRKVFMMVYWGVVRKKPHGLVSGGVHDVLMNI